MILMVLFEETGSLDNNSSNDECDSTNEFKEFYEKQKFYHLCCTGICKPFKMQIKYILFP